MRGILEKMANKTYKLTQAGVDELRQELEQLKAQRGEIADKIAAARDFGDLSENSEYDAARTEQGLLESRIAEIEDIVANVEIIKLKTNGQSSGVALGSLVTVEAENGQAKTYTIVGAVEANPLEGKISDESPIGQSILNKRVGDKFKVTTPKGSIVYKIVSIN